MCPETTHARLHIHCAQVSTHSECELCRRQAKTHIESTLILAVSSALQDWKKVPDLEHFRALPWGKKKKKWEALGTLPDFVGLREGTQSSHKRGGENWGRHIHRKCDKRNHFPQHKHLKVIHLSHSEFMSSRF